MKLKITTLALSSLLFTTAFAQNAESETKNRLSLTVAASVPTSDFGDNSIDNEDAGYSESGVKLAINYDYLIKSNIAVTFSAGVLRYGGNEEDFEENTARQAEINNLQGVTYSGSFDGYSITFLELGLKAYLNEGSSRFFLAPSFGVANATQGSVLFEAAGPGGAVYVLQDEAKASAAIYSIAAGVELLASDNVTLDFFAGYSGANFEFEDVEATSQSSSTGRTTIEEDFEQQFSAINIGASIGFKF